MGSIWCACVWVSYISWGLVLLDAGAIEQELNGASVLAGPLAESIQDPAKRCRLLHLEVDGVAVLRLHLQVKLISILSVWLLVLVAHLSA